MTSLGTPPGGRRSEPGARNDAVHARARWRSLRTPPSRTASSQRPAVETRETSADLLLLQGVLCAGYWTTCWKVGRLTQGMEGTVPTPMALNWMSSSSGLHLARSPCPEPGSAPPVSLVREQVQVVGSLLP